MKLGVPVPSQIRAFLISRSSIQVLFLDISFNSGDVGRRATWRPRPRPHGGPSSP